MKNINLNKSRDTFYEPFSAKTYYNGPAFDQEVSTPGQWYLYHWGPYYLGGDYVAVIGDKETFFFADTLRALIYTPKIWFNLELHTKCR